MHSLKGGCIVKEIPGLRISLVQVDSCCALAFDNAAQSERNGRFMAPPSVGNNRHFCFVYFLLSVLSALSMASVPIRPGLGSLAHTVGLGFCLAHPCIDGCSFALCPYGSALPGAASPWHGSFT